MVRDQAIFEGLIEPNKTDIEKLQLTKDDLARLAKLRKQKSGAAPAASKKKNSQTGRMRRVKPDADTF